MKKRQGRKIRIKNRPKLIDGSVEYLLEAGTLADMRAAKQVTAQLLEYHWNYYSELARQRNAIQDQIQQVLLQPCISYELEKWQRAVKYKYGLHPLRAFI